MDTRG